ncbi:MAG TPA: hypothetical protein VEC58_03800 [Roseiarcus sp.]|jgi:hypothetical protein|nr:hypothetical protein [Roseiarcus sp.]
MSNKYVYLYSGGNPPKSEAEGKAMMKAWMDYFGKIGGALVDGGAPFARGESKLFGKAQHSHATGYSIVQAENLKQAIALTDGHPHLAQGGGIEVFECAKM